MDNKDTNFQFTNMYPKSNSVAFGRYRLVAEIGRGGMGVVYKALDSKLNAIVALKVINSDRQENLQRFFVEATAVAKLNHPNIIRFYEFDDYPRPYFTMEYVEGFTLAQLIKNRSIKPSQLVPLMIQLCDALHYAHSNNVMHRDIKPSNILIGKDGIPKIMDFGLAKISNASQQLSKTGQVMGTTYYMSPEQVHGRACYQSDIYSLGASMYELLTFRTVYQGESEINVIIQITESTPIPLRQLNPDISPYLEAICLKCLHKNPNKRYRNFEELANEFRNFQAQRPIIARKYSYWDTLANFIAKHKIICTCVVLIFLILTVSLGITVNALSYAEQESQKAQHAAQKTQREKDKTREALNKVMNVLNYTLHEHRFLQEDKEFTTLFSQIFQDVEKYGENQDWSFLKGYVTQRSGNKEQSIAYYTQQINNNPQNAKAYLNRGIVYKNSRQYDKALADYNRAQAISPGYGKIYANRGVVFHERKEYHKALHDFNIALKIDEYDHVSYGNRANLYSDLRQYDKALVDYQKALQLDPQNPTYASNLAVQYRTLRQYDKALHYYNRSLKFDVKNGERFFNRASIYLARKEYEKAIRDYLQSIKLDAKNSKAHVNLGIAYADTNRPNLAITHFTKAIALNPHNGDTYSNRGTIYHQQKKYQQAMDDYNKALQILPQNFDIRQNRAILYHELENYPRALEEYHQVIKLNPQMDNPYIQCGKIYAKAGQYKRALPYFQKAAALKTQDSQTYYGLYHCYQKLGNPEKAQYYLRKAEK